MRIASIAAALLLGLALSASPAHASSAKPKLSLPPGEEQATAALNASPRHGEFLDIPREGGAPIRTWVVYPERKDKAGVVMLIHEIYGLSDWLRAVADQLAADGFVAVAPDLISGMGPGGGGTDSAATRDDVVKLVRQLTLEETNTRLDVVRAHVRTLPASNGKLATLGFCWGGGRSFSYAATPEPPQGAVVFYGASPDSAAIGSVRAPVIGFYGADDARVNATIDPARQALAKLGRSYEAHVFDGAGHGFLRAQAQRDGANLRATQQAWPRALAFLRRTLK